MDACTIHIEGFPKEMTPESMVKVFQRAGVVRHIKLPKMPDGQLKGFCFIEFSEQKEALNAQQLFNNCIPEEFTNNQNANYIQRKDVKITPLKVISKKEWLEHKRELTEIKKELADLRPKTPKVDFQEQFKAGSLIKLSGLNDITKQQLTDRIKQVVIPTYVDLQGTSSAVVRFKSKEECDTFQRK